MSTSESNVDQNNYPLVTIAIPTFNRASLLKECVRCALSQTYEHFEVLVSNNASSDDTREMLNGFSDERLRVIEQETNIGLLPNWNACVTAAKGDYIVVVSDDDRIAPWMLTRCISLMKEQPEIPIVVTLSNLHSGSLGKTFPALESKSLVTGIQDGTEVLTQYLTDEISITMCSVMLRTELLRERGGFPLYLPHTADVAAWAPLLLLGKVGFVNEACATFTYHGNSETARLSVEQLLSDGWKTANLISCLAAEGVGDVPRRDLIQAQSRRFFARRGLIVLSDFRNNGGGIQTLLNFIWRFRRYLKGVDITAVLRFLAIVLCPRPIADRIRQLRQTVPEQPA
jgi:glycosyltransferase involved in cell wall biosynthesis